MGEDSRWPQAVAVTDTGSPSLARTPTASAPPRPHASINDVSDEYRPPRRIARYVDQDLRAHQFVLQIARFVGIGKITDCSPKATRLNFKQAIPVRKCGYRHWSPVQPAIRRRPPPMAWIPRRTRTTRQRSCGSFQQIGWPLLRQLLVLAATGGFCAAWEGSSDL